MTNSYPSVTPSEEYTTSSAGSTAGAADTAKETAGTAKEQAANLGHATADAAGQVTGVAKDEAAKVASEAKTQAKDLYHQTRSELRDQAGVQQERVATGLHSLGDELRGMADKSETSGVGSDLVHQAASRVSGVAKWLEDRDPGSLLDDVKSFARQRPGAFIAIAAGAGILAGRLTRSLASEASDAKAASAAPTTTGVTGTAGTPYVTPATAGYSTVTPATTDPAVYAPSTGAHVAEPTMASAGYVAGDSSYAAAPETTFFTDSAGLVDAEGTDVETSGYDPRTDAANRFGADESATDDIYEIDDRPTTGLDGTTSMGNNR